MIHGARSTFLRYLESARAGSTAPRRCVLILAAWDGQAVSRAACRRLRLATRAVTRRFCRNARNCGKSVAVAWPFHPASGIHPLRRNGGGVLHGTCTARSLLQPGAQPRGGGSPLLLYLSVSVRGWRRRREHRREPRPQIAAANRIRTPASSWWPSKAYGSPAWARPPLACR